MNIFGFDVFSKVNVANFLGVLGLSNGGTNSSASLNNERLIKSAGNAMVEVAATNVQTGTSYTLVAADFGRLITFNNASPITVTLPQQSTLTTATSFFCWVRNLGAGTITFVKEGSETLIGNSSCEQNATCRIGRPATTVWGIHGGTASDPWQIPAARVPAVPVANAEYVIVAKAKKPFVITGFAQGATSFGTAGTYTIKIDGVNVTGLAAVANATTLTETAATANNTVAAGQKVTITFDGTISTPVGYYGDLSITQKF